MVRGPDAPWERGQRAELELPERRARWRTPDAAVLDALERPPGGARALPIGPRQGGSEQDAQAYRDDVTVVLAALGALGLWERRLVEWYAQQRHARQGGYRLLAQRSRAEGGPGRECVVREAHVAARARLHARLVVVGVCEP